MRACRCKTFTKINKENELNIIVDYIWPDIVRNKGSVMCYIEGDKMFCIDKTGQGAVD